ncbi:helix-turn-helix transcriptional regulator [Romboutsia hominis]|uniref:helix-turn-helix transcriptional regulator n=1 Tax=Romboutsia hominis TaxID=1507512 RepID=UPI001F062DE4|nr:WYL domain-containing transcriptional regulator [Romboutsia hominis]MCH1959924.1 WYL domain-containing transcriptional regulator [Romboutsia hominis]MCH1969653.1 WYL domain-containing transcriptional regulator [Romboutsia hominis]
MSKFSNLLRLLTLLKSNKRMKRKDIAEALGVSERMVRKYITDLIDANINIESIAGPNGGYELIGYDYLLNLNINDQEIIALELALEELKNNYNEVTYMDSLKTLGEKLKISSSYNQEQIYSSVCESSPMYLTKEKDFELDIQAACISRNKLRISYNSISSGDSVRIIRPYAVITRNNMKYLIAYCEKRKKELTFKLVRINWIEVIDEKFDLDPEFNIKEFMKNTIGIFNDEEIHLKLLIEKPFSYSVSEKQYVNNQIITWNSDESILFEASMSGKPDIIKWILSMGTSITILEPKELKQEVKDILIKMVDKI